MFYAVYRTEIILLFIGLYNSHKPYVIPVLLRLFPIPLSINKTYFNIIKLLEKKCKVVDIKSPGTIICYLLPPVNIHLEGLF